MAAEIESRRLFSYTARRVTPSADLLPSKMSNPLRAAVEILEDRLYYLALKTKPPEACVNNVDGDETKRKIHFFSIDNELVYWNFFLDFGPLNLGQLYRFCTKLNQKLASLPDDIICFYSSNAAAKRANAVCLICCWQVLFLKRSPEESFHGFCVTTNNATPVGQASSSPPRSRRANTSISPLPPFHDASPCACTYELTVLDCLKGLAKARDHNFFSFDTFDVEEYEHFEQVENGDLNWIVYGKIVAFAGPSYQRRVSPEGYCTLAPADYIPYFKEKNVSLVVRLNRKAYNEDDFRKAGIDHVEHFYNDGSCPPISVLDRIIEAFERVPSENGFAVHCKAGLGRTGTCIGAYLMKHYRFTASEAIAWMRICRPGCVIGPQQQFLKEIEQRMWQLGTMESSIDAGSRILSFTSRSGCERPSLRSSGEKSDAVGGRSGQAEGLLSARARYRNDRHRKETSTPRPASLQLKPKVVTPDPPGKSKCDTSSVLYL